MRIIYLLFLIFIVTTLAFVILIFLPIVVKVEYDSCLVLSLKILCLNFRFKFGNKDAKNLDSENKKDNVFMTYLHKLKKQPKKLCEDLNKLRFYFTVTTDLFFTSIDVIKKIHFEKVVLRMKIGGEDSYSIATNYGEISSAVYGIVAALFNYNEPEKYFISVKPDLFSCENKINFEISAKLNLFSVLGPAVFLLKNFVFSKKYSYFRKLRRLKR